MYCVLTVRFLSQRRHVHACSESGGAGGGNPSRQAQLGADPHVPYVMAAIATISASATATRRALSATCQLPVESSICLIVSISDGRRMRFSSEHTGFRCSHAKCRDKYPRLSHSQAHGGEKDCGIGGECRLCEYGGESRHRYYHQQEDYGCKLHLPDAP